MKCLAIFLQKLHLQCLYWCKRYVQTSTRKGLRRVAFNLGSNRFYAEDNSQKSTRVVMTWMSIGEQNNYHHNIFLISGVTINHVICMEFVNWAPKWSKIIITWSSTVSTVDPYSQSQRSPMNPVNHRTNDFCAVNVLAVIFIALRLLLFSIHSNSKLKDRVYYVFWIFVCYL